MPLTPFHQAPKVEAPLNLQEATTASLEALGRAFTIMGNQDAQSLAIAHQIDKEVFFRLISENYRKRP